MYKIHCNKLPQKFVSLLCKKSSRIRPSNNFCINVHKRLYSNLILHHKI